MNKGWGFVGKDNEFAKDVLEILKQRKVTFHGCKPWYLEHMPGGDTKIWFYGHRSGIAWAGGIKLIKRDDVNNAVMRGKSEIMANICEQIIDETNTRFN